MHSENIKSILIKNINTKYKKDKKTKKNTSNT